MPWKLNMRGFTGMNNTDAFLEKYKQVEAEVRSQYNYDGNSTFAFLQGLPKYKQMATTIKTCREVRNLLQHVPKYNGEYSIVPSDDLVTFLDKLIQKVSERKTCSDVGIRFKDIYWRALDDSVKEAMHVMRQRTYTHVPILDDKQHVIGVFDENSVFDYLADEGIIDVDEDLQFRSIQKYLSVSGREMEEFLFLRPSAYVEDLEVLIDQAFNVSKRVGMAFLTQDGKKDSPLFGIVTPWDIIASNQT